MRGGIGSGYREGAVKLVAGGVSGRRGLWVGLGE